MFLIKRPDWARIMVLVDMSDFGSRAHGFRFYEQLRAMDDMNVFGS